MYKVKLLAGRSNLPLAESISKSLGKTLVSRIIEPFPSTEIRVEIDESIRGCDVFIVQTASADAENSVNDYIIETLLLIDACKRSGAESVSVICCNLFYARSDKKDKPRVPIGASMIANILKAAGCNRIISMDLHSGQIQGFANIPFDNLYGIKLHIDELNRSVFVKETGSLSQGEINDKYILVSLDVGGAKRIRDFAKRLKMSHAIMDKQRDYSKNSEVTKSVIIGDSVKDKIAICIDDMCDTAGTLIAGITDLKEHGASSAIVVVTHGIFSGPAFIRINKCDFIDKMIVINTLDQTQNLLRTDKLIVVDSGPLFAEIIEKIIGGGSISKSFV